MAAYTFEETADRLSAYEQWAAVSREGSGRELFEGPDAASAKSLTAPGPLENLRTHQAGRYSIHQIYDAYRICELLAALVQRGNHLYSKGTGETELRQERQLEFLMSKLAKR